MGVSQCTTVRNSVVFDGEDAIVKAEEFLYQQELETLHKYVKVKSTNFKKFELPKTLRKIFWEEHSSPALPIRYDGIPFLVVGKQVRECWHGPDRHKAKKNKNIQRNKTDHIYSNKGRRQIQSSQKLNCPATLYLRYVVRFPEYKEYGSDKEENIEEKEENFEEILLKSEIPVRSIKSVIEDLYDMMLCDRKKCREEDHQRHHDFLNDPLGFINENKKIHGFCADTFGIDVCNALGEQLNEDMIVTRHLDIERPYSLGSYNTIENLPSDSQLERTLKMKKCVAVDYMIHVLLKEVLIICQMKLTGMPYCKVNDIFQNEEFTEKVRRGSVVK